MLADPSSEHLALRIVQQLRAAGHLAYFAGGCVRDRLMHRPPKDYDVATAATPDEVLRLFPRSQKIGAAFGVVLVRHHKAHAEVATFRTDGHYSDGRHPDSVRFSTPEEDAQRRDFTCNGLFFDPLTSTLHDFVGGESDIQNRLLRAIGNPADRFREDHLRILRAIRFAARLDFQIEPATRAAMEQLQTHVASVSRERIGEELRLMLEHPTRITALELLTSLTALFPLLLGLPADLLQPTPQFTTVGSLPAQARRHEVLAALLIDLYGDLAPWPPEIIPALRTHLVLTNEETDALTWLSQKLPLLDRWEDLSVAATKRLLADPRWPSLELLFRADPDHASQLLPFREHIDTLSAQGVAPPPFITGEALIALGAHPGKNFKKWLDALYDRQLEGEFPTPEAAQHAARTLLANQP